MMTFPSTYVTTSKKKNIPCKSNSNLLSAEIFDSSMKFKYFSGNLLQPPSHILYTDTLAGRNQNRESRGGKGWNGTPRVTDQTKRSKKNIRGERRRNTLVSKSPVTHNRCFVFRKKKKQMRRLFFFLHIEVVILIFCCYCYCSCSCSC
jgi:hypothetical protein